MKTLYAKAIGAAAALTLSASAQALVIGFAPPAQNLFAGQTASVDLVLSGLTAQNQIVSGFDIDVAYTGDPTVIFVDGVYGDGLGIVDIDTISFTPTATGGVVELFNSSFLSDADLGARQGDSVVLATLRFRSNVPITSQLSINYNPATDITGFQDPGSPNVFPTQLIPGPADGSITWIQRNGTPVPAPGTLWLLALPIAWLSRRACRLA